MSTRFIPLCFFLGISGQLKAAALIVTRRIHLISCLRSLKVFPNSARYNHETSDRNTQLQSITAGVSEVEKRSSVKIDTSLGGKSPLLIALAKHLNRGMGQPQLTHRSYSPAFMAAVREKLTFHKSGDESYIQHTARVDWRRLAMAPELTDIIEKAMAKTSLSREEFSKKIGPADG